MYSKPHKSEAEIQLWCEDEHRLGLKPILKQVYVPEGETPIANVNWRYQWLWLYAFVHPKTGETYWWILPSVDCAKLLSRETRCLCSRIDCSLFYALVSNICLTIKGYIM